MIVKLWLMGKWWAIVYLKVVSKTVAKFMEANAATVFQSNL